jgi:predicted TIM-barrel enzyme
MVSGSLFGKIFNKIPILGMIHLAGNEPVKRALEEIAVYEIEGIDGVIIENYHGTVDDVIQTLKKTSRMKSEVVVGVNILPNEFEQAFSLAHEYGADFIQLDYVAGRYDKGELDYQAYSACKEKYSNIVVLGGVWPKYYTPVEGSDLVVDLIEAKSRAEAVVVTGAGTGVETPLGKIKEFREIIGEYPLVVGAGLTVDNAYDQLCISDGAIVGSFFKEGGETRNPVDRRKIRDFMSIVGEAREYQNYE